MAFQALPETMWSRGKEPTNIPSIAIHYATQASVSIPRTLLREAGLPDIPGAKFDVLVGSGSDAGSIAIIAGSRFTASAQGPSSKPNRLIVRFAGLHQRGVRYSATKVAFEVGRKQLILGVPTDFPVAPPPAPEPASIAGSRQTMKLGAAA